MHTTQYITPRDQERAEIEGAQSYRQGITQNPHEYNAMKTARNYGLFHAWQVGYDMEKDYWKQPGCDI